MRNWPKNIFSLIIALIFISLLLLLPDADIRFRNSLNFLAKSDNTAIAFGYYLVQKIISGLFIILLTIAISIAGHRAYKRHKEESR